MTKDQKDSPRVMLAIDRIVIERMKKAGFAIPPEPEPVLSTHFSLAQLRECVKHVKLDKSCAICLITKAP